MRRALLLLALVAGCRAAEAPPTRPFTDDLGRSVSVPAAPRRVASLAPNVTEIVAAVGALDRLAARTPNCDVPPAAARLPAVQTYPLDREALVALGADLAIGTDQINDPAEGDALGALGVPAVYLHFETLADVPRAMRRVGALLGVDAEPAAARFERRLGPLPAPGGPRVLVLIGDDVLYAFGRASYVSEMVRRAGGQAVTDAFAGASAVLSSEFVLESRPDVVVVLAEAYGPADLRAAQPAWAALPALARGAVCGVDPDVVVRPGPRLADGVEALRACIGAR